MLSKKFYSMSQGCIACCRAPTNPEFSGPIFLMYLWYGIPQVDLKMILVLA